jgi:transposase
MQGETNRQAWVERRFNDIPIAELEGWAKKHLSGRDLVVLESSANSFELVRRLEQAGISACVLESQQVSKTADGYVDDDVIAAERIARCYLTGISKVVWVPDEQCRQRRELLHTYQGARRAETRAINQLKGFLNQYHIRLQKRNVRQEATHQWVLEQRSWSATQQAVLKHLMDQLNFCVTQSNQLFTLICSEVLRDEWMRGCLRLMGIGPINAFAIVATVGDINRFSSPNKLVAYLGLNPGRLKSGTGKDIKIGVGRRGCKAMRSLLIQGAQAIMRLKKGNALRDWGWQLFARKGNRNEAVAAVARKLVIQLWHLLKGHGITRQEQRGPLQRKLTQLCQGLGKTGREALGLPVKTSHCVAHLMEQIDHPLPKTI